MPFSQLGCWSRAAGDRKFKCDGGRIHTHGDQAGGCCGAVYPLHVSWGLSLVFTSGAQASVGSNATGAEGLYIPVLAATYGAAAILGLHSTGRPGAAVRLPTKALVAVTCLNHL
jgi:hypothetical protein